MSTTPEFEMRARELVSRLTLEQRAGLLFHPMVLLHGPVDLDAPSPLGFGSLRELVVDRGIRFLCLGGAVDLRTFAEASAPLRELALTTGSRLPLVFSTDPRHSFLQNAAATHAAADVSQWPEPLGLGALDDPALVREFAATVRADYLAAGIRMALHPQVDLATEPRWARQAQSFGADPASSARLVVAYLEGLQGATLGSDGIAAATKHFPGGGPQLDGDDAHFPYGREQVYPGGRFEDHLLPFRAAIDAGTAAIMPYYGMPIGLELDGRPVEEVGFSFNRQIVTGLLREKLGFRGVVLSDFGLVTDATVFGKPFPARAWGVEHLSPPERVAKLLHAGVDQLGGESGTDLLLGLVAEGAVAAERVTESAERMVALQLRLGLLDQTDDEPAPAIGTVTQLAAGRRAQSRAITILDDRDGRLPVAGERRVHLSGVDPASLPAGWAEAKLDEAELAIVRLAAPFEPRDTYFLEDGMEQGSLEFPPGVVAEIVDLADRVPVILVVTLSRPAILTPFADRVAVLAADFGASDAALLDALTGVVPPEGRLPFELPRDMAAVEAGAPDVPSDTVDPLYPAGWRFPDPTDP
jgi:beta-glucosidase